MISGVEKRIIASALLAIVCFVVFGIHQATASLRGASDKLERVLALPPEPESIFEEDEADVAYNVGVKYYRDDKSVYINYAMKWFQRAAELGSEEGQYRVGVAYEWGEGQEKDYKAALKWYRLSAEQKNKGGQYGLGSLYANGRGVKQNFKEAAKWYALSAEQGFHRAQYELGILYLEGSGVLKSEEQAYFWLSLAAEELDEAMLTREKVIPNLSAEQIQDIHLRLNKWQGKFDDDTGR